MPAIVTQSFRENQVKSYLDFVTHVANNVYLFIGNPLPWEEELDPPLPVDNDDAIFRVWDRIYGMKSIPTAGISRVIRRRDWQQGIFEYYNTTMPKSIDETNFYCMTSNFEVYKCLWNNNEADSTVEPTGQGNDNIVYTSDGYIWAYMYTISTGEAQTFLTPDYIPVKIDSIVEGKAPNNAGKVIAVGVKDGGDGYLSVNFGGNPTRHASAYAVVVGGSITKIVITDPGEGYTTNPSIEIFGGGGTNATFPNATTQGGSINVQEIPATNGGTGYNAPVVSTVAGSGTGLVAHATARNGVIQNIHVEDGGEGYIWLNLEITAGTGAGAKIDPVLTPAEGHGFNAEYELGGNAIMFSTNLNASEMGDALPAGNSYRNIGIIVNPHAAGGGVYTGPFDTNMIKMYMGITPGNYYMNEVVTGATSGAKGRVVFWDSSTRHLYIIQTLDEGYTEFQTGEDVTGSEKTANIITLAGSAFDKYTGDIQYIENRSPVTRTASQIEDVRVVVEF